MQKNTQIYSLFPDRKYLAAKIYAAILTTIIFVITLLWTQNLWAKEKKIPLNENPVIQQQASDFIRSLANEALTGLKQKNTTLAEQESYLNKILHKGFNIRYIGKISLGRYRKRATAKDLKKYYSLFPEYLIKVYTNRLTKLDTRKVEVGRIFPNGKRDMYVRTKIINGEQKTYDVDWRVRPSKGDAITDHSYKIIDIKIEGISMVRTQRDDFSSRISSSGMNGLINFMQSIINNTVEVTDDKKSG